MPQKLLETVLRLDTNGDIAGIQQYVVENRYGVPQIAVVLPHLLNQRRIRAAYILAMMINRVGHQDCGVAMALAAGGLLFNKPEDEARGLNMLQVQTDAQTVPQQTFMDEHVIPKVLITLLQTILPLSDDKLVVRVIEILRAASPQYRAVFDWNAPVADLSLEALRQRGREQTRLTISPRLPVGTPRVRRRVFLMAPVQDYLDQLSVAMNRYGWEVETWHRNHTDAAASEDCRVILETCQQKNMDILFLMVDFFVKLGDGMKTYREMKQQLLQHNPSLKIFGVLGDVNPIYGRDKACLEMTANFFDGVLSPFTFGFFSWANPHFAAFAGKMVVGFLLPVQDESLGSTDKPLVPSLYFRGDAHWTRRLWFSAIHSSGLPFRKRLKKENPVEDIAAYMRDLYESTCCLSLTTLNWGALGWLRCISGRSFEIPLSGALLVQEYSPQMHRCFTPGEHYLEFTTIAELAAIVRFIADRPEEAEEIRRCGHAFAREHYSSDAIISQIDRYLYFPG